MREEINCGCCRKVKIKKFNKKHIYCKSCAREQARKFSYTYTKISKLNKHIKDLKQKVNMLE